MIHFCTIGNKGVAYSTDRSKTVAPMLVLLFVSLWFILRGDLFYILPCVILFLCFFRSFSIAITSLGEERASLGVFVRLFALRLMILFHLPLGVWEGLRPVIVALPWFFLTFSVVNSAKSQCTPILSGVPKDTILGPPLFSFYINDIMLGIKSEIRLFDDCVCYRQNDSIEDTSNLQKDIDQLGKWARKWDIRFQPVKSNIMQLTRKRIKKINAVYSLERTVLENVDNIKYLDVTISKDLKWNTHVSNVCTKTNGTLRFLRRNLSSCPSRC